MIFIIATFVVIAIIGYLSRQVDQRRQQITEKGDVLITTHQIATIVKDLGTQTNNDGDNIDFADDTDNRPTRDNVGDQMIVIVGDHLIVIDEPTDGSW